ncbi:N-acetyltransferase [Brevibacillus daliensis]|uniref:N-acetyltransferase n=1 Tax=Brevibacillus daliensis TaxID=2892995 RepID=UPI001E324C1F|nr:GNAT family N-acetyltransferase [Brevibacillus daliensis]
MAIKEVTVENLQSEHICCAISDKKGECGVASKKAWLQERMSEGLVFKKLDVRGKVFIEYVPAEYAWCPVDAEGYMYINCFWVSGQYKGHGHAKQLLEECINDAKAKGRRGLVVLSSKKKKPFLSDAAFLSYKGFTVCDTAAPYFELMYLPFQESAEQPKFKEVAKHGKISEKGIVLYYSNQCPHTEKYVHLIKEIACERQLNFTLIKIETTKQAQESPTPWTTYGLYIEGEFITNEILSDKKFLKILEEKGCIDKPEEKVKEKESKQ